MSTRPVVAVGIANVVARTVIRVRVAVLVYSIPIMPSIPTIAAGESHGRNHHQNGGGGFIASHWLFILKSISDPDNTIE
jgi:hypothetical protein